MIPIWPYKTGLMTISDYDAGIYRTMGAVPDATDPLNPCYKLTVPGLDPDQVPVFWGQPEPIFTKKVLPFITITRDDITPNNARWMSCQQLEYRAGVSGTDMMANGVSGFAQYERKIQAQPYDFSYTISCWDRYERPTQLILSKLLKRFPPIGKIFVTDSLGLERTYSSYQDSPITPLHEILDPTRRVRGYSLTIRVEGELDLIDPTNIGSVSGIDLTLYRQ